MIDPSHMRAALALARRGLGTTWPNPSVGCVIVRRAGGRPRRTRHRAGGRMPRPQALAMAGEAARGADAYVTLEPCNHTGQIAALHRSVDRRRGRTGDRGRHDPDPRVNGAGLARLREAGIRS